MLREKIRIRKIAPYKDERGLLAKLFDYAALDDKHIQDIYVTYTKPGQSRADHYHKKTTEWFCAIKGKGILKLKAIDSNEELEITLDAKEMNLVEVPPGINHQIFAKGKEELILIAFGNQPYKKDDTDTYFL